MLGRPASRKLLVEYPDSFGSQAIVSLGKRAGFRGIFMPEHLHGESVANLDCKPLPGGIGVQDISHCPVYSAGSAVYIKLNRK